MLFKPYQLVHVQDTLPTVQRGIRGHHYVAETISMVTPDSTIMIRRVPGFAGTLAEVSTVSLQPCTWRQAYVHLAEIDGRGHFPLDMLRHDQCVPVNFTITEDCRAKLIEGLGNKLVVARCKQTRALDAFTVDRWQSFCWNITTIDCEKVL